MTDIVERLKAIISLNERTPHRQEMWEAKAEIERLQVEVRTVLKREAETTRRNDERLDALEARLAEAVEVIQKIKELSAKRSFHPMSSEADYFRITYAFLAKLEGR